MLSTIRTRALLLALVAMVATSGPDTALLDAGHSILQATAGNGTNETFTRTVVVLGSDGHQQLSVETITRAELERQKVRRTHTQSNGLAFALVGQAHADGLVHASCSDPNSMWLFDRPNLDGNVICLNCG